MARRFPQHNVTSCLKAHLLLLRLSSAVSSPTTILRPGRTPTPHCFGGKHLALRDFPAALMTLINITPRYRIIYCFHARLGAPSAFTALLTATSSAACDIYEIDDDG